MNLYKLEKEFATEKQCREYIASLRWKNGYICPYCKSKQAWKTKEIKYKCQNCGHKISVTSGTIFQGSHIPLPIWFKAIWHISSQPMLVTASYLQKELSIGSNRTALHIFHKLKLIMIYPVLEKLQGNVEIITTDILIANKKVFVAIAVEVNHQKIGRIRIAPIARGVRTDIVDFIDSCIESESTIIHREENISIFELYEDYTKVLKTERYNFSCTQRVVNKLNSWLRNTNNEKSVDSLLDDFCMRFNSLKSKIPFYVLLKNAVNTEPHSNMYGIE